MCKFKLLVACHESMQASLVSYRPLAPPFLTTALRRSGRNSAWQPRQVLLLHRCDCSFKNIERCALCATTTSHCTSAR